mgnify:CR=1 FL=1
MTTYRVVINKDISIYCGEAIICYNKMNALNVASAVARALYNIGIQIAHIFVVENVDTVKYHYVVCFEKNYKQILLYDGICNNRKTIVKQVIK